jgi:putative transposase
MTVKMRKTYSYKLYATDRTKHLDAMLKIACDIWNHFIALQKRYYKIYGKYISAYRMKTHLTKLLKQEKYAEWKMLGSQARQDIIERIDRSYQAFFQWCKKRDGKRKSPPKSKKDYKYNSFTLKQNHGWEISGNVITIARKYRFKFWRHRDFHGEVKTVTVKRNRLGEYFIYLSVIEEVEVPDAHTGNAVGIDFGLKTFLNFDDGSKIESPLWFFSNIKAVKKAHRNFSKKEKGSRNRRKSGRALAKVYDDISNQRTDWFFKLAKELTEKYSVICIEDLNMEGMKRLWGRKVSDLAFGEFVSILEYEAMLHGCQVVKIDRWYPSSKTCHNCGYVKKDLSLKDRVWTCQACGETHDRDINAAKNILDHGLLQAFGATVVA